MARLAWLGACASTIGFGAATVLGGCGGSTATDLMALAPDGGTTTDGDDDRGHDAGADISIDPTDAGDVDGDAPGEDAATTEDAGSGGLITCGTSTCLAASQVCCVGRNDSRCIGANDKCEGAVQGCDEKADCASGYVCCVSGFQTNQLAAECATSCQAGSGGFGLQLCKTDAECTNGTCFTNTCQGNRVVQACSRIPTCSQ